MQYYVVTSTMVIHERKMCESKETRYILKVN